MNDEYQIPSSTTSLQDSSQSICCKNNKIPVQIFIHFSSLFDSPLAVTAIHLKPCCAVSGAISEAPGHCFTLTTLTFDEGEFGGQRWHTPKHTPAKRIIKIIYTVIVTQWKVVCKPHQYCKWRAAAGPTIELSFPILLHSHLPIYLSLSLFDSFSYHF